MVTYIIKSQEVYKIGKTKDLDDRLAAYRTHNPFFELIYVIPVDCEELLHVLFKDKRLHLEWFKLNDNDILKIIQLSEDYGIVQDQAPAPNLIITLKHNTSTNNYIVNNDNNLVLTSKFVEYLKTITDITTLRTNEFNKLLNRLIKKGLAMKSKCAPTGVVQIIYTLPYINWSQVDDEDDLCDVEDQD